MFYAYRYIDVDGPDWGPLERTAERTVKRRDLPTVDADDFMYGGHLRSLDGRPDLHLYKHYNTRSYLNVDDRLQYYVFLFGELGKPWFEATVYYRRLRSLRTAVDMLDLHLLTEHASADDVATTSNVVPLRRPARPGGRAS